MNDTAELEREAEAARARLSDTADQLRAKMSPGQLMDEVLNQFREGDGNMMLSNLRTQARDNPMALALIGSGVAWLMFGSGSEHRSIGSSYRPPSPAPRQTTYFSDAPARPLVGDQPDPDFGSDEPNFVSSAGSYGDEGLSFHEEGEALREEGRSVRDAVGERLHAAGDRIGEFAGGLQARGAGAIGGAREAAAGLGNQVQGAASDLSDRTRRTFLDVLEREPLVIGALGLAVGAAIGALLPASEIERQHLAPAGEALKDRAASLVNQGTAAAKEAVSEVYEKGKEEADRQGLVPGDKPLAEKVEAVVRAAGEQASSIAHDRLEDVSQSSRNETQTEQAGEQRSSGTRNT